MAYIDFVVVIIMKTAFALGEIKADLEQQLDYLCQLKFTQDELDYLRGLRFIKSDFCGLFRIIFTQTPLYHRFN